MIKVFEMFAGYGGCSFGLKKANIPHEVVGYSEIDKFAIQCWEQNHIGKNFGDCTKINPNDIPYFDLLTGGFPCQDVSIAGKRDLTKGRTNLYQEILRIAEVKKPKYMLLENVKGLLSIGKDRNLRDIIINDLNKIGYGVAFKLLNSKDFGIPQNRERVWFVCKLGGWKFGEFHFPIERELKLFIKDILEDDVDSKYYLRQEQVLKIFNRNRWGDHFSKINDASPTLCAIGSSDVSIIIDPRKYKDEIEHRTYENIIPTLMARARTDETPLILNPFNGKNSTTESGTIGTSVGSTTGKTAQLLIQEQTIRKLTPKECFRLMGFLNDEINLEGISDSQKYKLAGNGWDVNLVSLIFKNMFFNDK